MIALPRVALATVLAMIAFAGNSLLCRLALKTTQVDAATFTTVRILTGAAVLWLIVRVRGGASDKAGSWLSALALFAYAGCFSFAYRNLPAGTGALLLFASVQAAMIGYGIWSGERLGTLQVSGLLLASGGLICLLLPGISAPSLQGSALMIGAGCAWAVYSLRGRNAGDAARTTAGNFLRAVPMTLLLSIAALPWMSLDCLGICYAMVSGALASGVGYAIWYTALPELKATQAATVQLSVPAIAAAGGIAFLGEQMTARLLIATLAILGGIVLVIFYRRRTA